MDILKRQRLIAEQAMKQRAEDVKTKTENPKPPKSPARPQTDISQGIAFGTRRKVGFGRKRRRTLKKSRVRHSSR